MSLSSKATGLDRAIVCIATVFAQMKDKKPVGGRGISDFSLHFFFVPEVFPNGASTTNPQRPGADGVESLTVSRELLQRVLSLGILFIHTVFW